MTTNTRGSTAEQTEKAEHTGSAPNDCPRCAEGCFCSCAASGSHTLNCILAHGRAADRAEARAAIRSVEEQGE